MRFGTQIASRMPVNSDAFHILLLGQLNKISRVVLPAIGHISAGRYLRKRPYICSETEKGALRLSFPTDTVKQAGIFTIVCVCVNIVQFFIIPICGGEWVRYFNPLVWIRFRSKKTLLDLTQP